MKINKAYLLNHVRLKLINAEQNSHILMNSPHKFFEDLAIVYIIVDSEDDFDLSCVVNNVMLSMFDIDIDYLHEAAYKNTKDDGFLICSISDLFNLAGTEDFVLYVLTSVGYRNGAAILIYNEELSAFANSINDDFYIIPSSVHELIAIPVSYGQSYNVDFIKGIIREINQEIVSSDEILGYSVYKFDQKSGKVTTIA